jgi:hypothetical protein
LISVIEIPAVVFIAAGVIKINFDLQSFFPSRIMLDVIAKAAPPADAYAPGRYVFPPRSAGTEIAGVAERLARALRRSLTSVDVVLVFRISNPVIAPPRVIAPPETI